MSFRFTHKGDFANLERFLKRMRENRIMSQLEPLGREGVAALESATPIDTGETSSSWGFTIRILKGKTILSWTNTHVVDGVNVAVLIQYGHGTGTGGWVQGQDYINPAIKPTMDKIAEKFWKEVTKA